MRRVRGVPIVLAVALVGGVLAMLPVADAAVPAPNFAWGSGGSGNGQFQSPSAVAVAPSGSVYVTDRLNNRVQQFTSAGVFVRKWGTAGTGVGQFSEPTGITVDPAGNVFVSDTGNNRIQKFTST